MNVIVDGQAIDVAPENVRVNLQKTLPSVPESSIKLMKMSKGYQWEIKVAGGGEYDDFALERIAEIDAKLTEKYGKTDEV